MKFEMGTWCRGQSRCGDGTGNGLTFFFSVAKQVEESVGEGGKRLSACQFEPPRPVCLWGSAQRRGGRWGPARQGRLRAPSAPRSLHLSHCLLLPFKWFRTQLQPACRGYVNVGKQPSQSQVGPASRCLTQLNGGGLFDHAAAMTLARPVPAQIFFVGILLI